MNTLFVYGTLLIDEILNRVCGKSFPCCRAILPDHARFRIRNAQYPAIIYRKGSSVEGKVYFDIDDVSLKRLDTFEGGHYERISMDVICEEGKPLTSYVYRIRESYAHFITDEPWDIRTFVDRGLASFLNEI